MGALKEQDAAHEPECSHVEHLCETSYFNSLVHSSPGTVPVHCKDPLPTLTSYYANLKESLPNPNKVVFG